jgi:hypothetical protein
MAKDFLSVAIQRPSQEKVNSTAWSICHSDHQIVKDIDQALYDLVHAPAAKKYWTDKGRVTENSFSMINWTRLGQALKKCL